MIDSNAISAVIHALESYRTEQNIEFELRQGDNPDVVAEVLLCSPNECKGHTDPGERKTVLGI